LCGGESYIVSSKIESFEVIDNILFKYNPDEKVHDNYIFDSHENELPRRRAAGYR